MVHPPPTCRDVQALDLTYSPKWRMTKGENQAAGYSNSKSPAEDMVAYSRYRMTDLHILHR